MQDIAISGRGLQLWAIGGLTGLATLAGGALALRLRGDVQRLMGFGGGVVIGVALMDLLPEALEQGRAAYASLTLTAVMAAGFMAYLLLSRIAERFGARSQGFARRLGPASLVFHSLMDGLGIGVAFDVSSAAGLVLAAAVLAHDLLDGANTVTLALSQDLGRPSSRRWLALDALAPLAGIGLSRAITPSPADLALLLALFAGLFLYIGAAELLPRSRAGGAGVPSAIAVALGAAFIFAIVSASLR